MPYQNLLLDELEPGILCLTVSRPKVLNALNSQTLDEIHAAAVEIANDSNVRVVLVTGAGDRAFVAGADIAEMQDFVALQGQAFAERGIRAFGALETLPVPVIAAVNGYCLGGGCELAMSCDWILAADTAVFGQPEVKLGIIPGFGGGQRLSRRVGKARALELVTSGRQVSADEAHAIGLTNHVYPAHELMAEALKVARLIAHNGPIAVRLAKEAVRRGEGMDLDDACSLDSHLFGLTCSTADQKEGMRAFLEKRDAEFNDR